MDDFYAKVTQIGWLLYKSPPNIASFFTQQKKAPPDCPGPKRPAVKQKKWSTSLRAGMHDCIYTERKKEKQMLPYPSSLTYLNVTIWYLTHHVTLKSCYLKVTSKLLESQKSQYLSRFPLVTGMLLEKRSKLLEMTWKHIVQVHDTPSPAHLSFKNGTFPN